MAGKDGVDIAVAGLSGQGIIMYSKVLTAVFAKSEYNVATYEVLGTAHRGTLVFTHVRIHKTDNIANVIPAGSADLLVGVEPLEGLRVGAYYVAEGSIALLNTRKIVPMYASIGRDFFSKQPRPLGYPSIEKIVAILEEMGIKTYCINATDIAEQAGHFAATNMVLLGASVATGLIPCTVDSVKGAIRRLVPAGTQEMNLRAFEMGIDEYQRLASRSCSRV